MIIRKPYAFLMKNFRKIHILLLLLAVFIFYKTNTFYSFVKEYMSLGVYNPLVESVKHYASDFLYLAIILVFFIIIAIVILLKKKKKPIIDYIVALAIYLFIFIVFIVGTRYFNNIGDNLIDEAAIRVVRDLLLICSIPQYIVFIWLMIRILGIDLNRFGFKEDEEFKEISEEDREEVEVAVEIDKDAYKREIKKRIRFLKYYYKENSFVLNIVLGVLSIVLIVIIGRFIALGDKTYREGKTFKANNYSITINDSYISQYNMNGDVIEKNSSFIIVDVTVVNNYEARTMDIEKFLLVGNRNKYVPTLKYNNDFRDLGTGYVKRDFKKDSKNNFILVYKVDNAMIKKKFVLYYQNVRGVFDSNYYKVRLKPEVYTSKINNGNTTIGHELTINDKKIKIVNMEIGDSYSYLHQKCVVSGCSIVSSELNSQSNKKIIKLDVDTKDYNGNSFIDFLDIYGKIVYRVKGKSKTVDIKNPITVEYRGNSSYFMVDNDIEEADEIYLALTVRNNKYKYYLKGDKVNERDNK